MKRYARLSDKVVMREARRLDNRNRRGSNA